MVQLRRMKANEEDACGDGGDDDAKLVFARRVQDAFGNLGDGAGVRGRGYGWVVRGGGGGSGAVRDDDDDACGKGDDEDVERDAVLRSEPCSIDETMLTADEAAIAALVGRDAALDDEEEEDEFDRQAMGSSSFTAAAGHYHELDRSELAPQTEVALVGNVWEERCARMDKAKALLERQTATNDAAGGDGHVSRKLRKT